MKPYGIKHIRGVIQVNASIKRVSARMGLTGVRYSSSSARFSGSSYDKAMSAPKRRWGAVLEDNESNAGKSLLDALSNGGLTDTPNRISLNEGVEVSKSYKELISCRTMNDLYLLLDQPYYIKQLSAVDTIQALRQALYNARTEYGTSTSLSWCVFWLLILFLSCMLCTFCDILLEK